MFFQSIRKRSQKDRLTPRAVYEPFYIQRESMNFHATQSRLLVPLWRDEGAAPRVASPWMTDANELTLIPPWRVTSNLRPQTFSCTLYPKSQHRGGIAGSRPTPFHPRRPWQDFCLNGGPWAWRWWRSWSRLQHWFAFLCLCLYCDCLYLTPLARRAVSRQNTANDQ